MPRKKHLGKRPRYSVRELLPENLIRKRASMSVNQDEIDFLEKLGRGSISAGVQKLIRARVNKHGGAEGTIVLGYDTAIRTINEICEQIATAPAIQPAWAAVIESAVRYARIRTDWNLADDATRRDADAIRTRAHDAFIDNCNILSRAMAHNGMNNDWRRTLGDQRKDLGDFACYLHCVLGLEAR